MCMCICVFVRGGRCFVCKTKGCKERFCDKRKHLAPEPRWKCPVSQPCTFLAADPTRCSKCAYSYGGNNRKPFSVKQKRCSKADGGMMMVYR